MSATRDSTSIGSWLWLAAFVGLLVLSDALDATLYRLAPPSIADAPTSRWLLVLVFAAAAILLAGRLHRAAELLRDGWMLWPPVLLAIASSLWSDQPGTTILWSAALVGTTAFGIALAARLSPLEQARLTASVATCVALATLLSVVFVPSFAQHKSGLWRGIYIHRNLLGKMLALGVVAGLAVWHRQRRGVLPLLAILSCGAALLPTGSRASLMVTVGVAALLALVLAARRWPQRAWRILIGGGVTGVLAVVLLLGTGPGLALVGRGPTFSDRTVIWRAVGKEAVQRPILGHGYAGFWPGPAGTRVRKAVRMSIGQAHDGALDVAAELGLVGLVLVFVPLALYAARAGCQVLTSSEPPCLWPLAYITFFIAANAAESSLLRHKIYWALYVAAASSVASGGGRRSPAMRRRR